MTDTTEQAIVIEKYDHEDESYPDGGLRAWLVVLGSFSLLFATFGFQTSVGLFQLHRSLNQPKEYSPSQIAWIPSVFIFLSLTLSIQTGAIFDRYGARIHPHGWLNRIYRNLLPTRPLLALLAIHVVPGCPRRQFISCNRNC